MSKKNTSDALKHIVTKKDVPHLKKNLEFDVRMESKYGGQSMLSPVVITFFCSEITCDEPRKQGDRRFDGLAGKIPCYFSTTLPKSDVKIDNAMVSMNFGNAINRTMRVFFRDVIRCKNQEEIEEKYARGIHLEKVKSLTDVYERKILTEKHNRKHKKKR